MAKILSDNCLGTKFICYLQNRNIFLQCVIVILMDSW
jgi:hypothetical protein